MLQNKTLLSNTFLLSKEIDKLIKTCTTNTLDIFFLEQLVGKNKRAFIFMIINSMKQSNVMKKYKDSFGFNNVIFMMIIFLIYLYFFLHKLITLAPGKFLDESK